MGGPSSDRQNLIDGGIEPPDHTLRIGANIQDNENPPGFICAKCTVFHRCYVLNEDALELSTICNLNQEAMQIHRCIPNRCNSCKRKLRSWQLEQRYKRLLWRHFNRQRHHHIRMITWGWLGNRTINVDDRDQVTADAKAELVAGMKALRCHQIWKEHVDGGIWFFECTEEPMDDGQLHINPHLHLVVLCPKIFPVGKMNDHLEDLRWRNAAAKTSKLGRCFINHSRNKDGTIKKSKPQDAINYCVAYAKRPEVSGKSRNTFGELCARRRPKVDRSARLRQEDKGGVNSAGG